MAFCIAADVDGWVVRGEVGIGVAGGVANGEEEGNIGRRAGQPKSWSGEGDGGKTG
jgi:hypothetical protein